MTYGDNRWTATASAYRTGSSRSLTNGAKDADFCVEFCPRNVLVMSRRTNTKGYHPPELTDDSQCINCGLCALLCPDFAIYVENGGMYPPDKIEPIHKTEVER